MFLALAPSVMILLTLVSYFTYARIAEVEVALAQHGVSVARQLAPGAEFALFAGDRAALQYLADAAARETDVQAISITDANGQLLARSGRDESGESGESIQFVQPVIQTRLPVSEFPEQMNASTPTRVGEIGVTMSRTAALAEQRRLLRSGLLLGLACVLVAIALAFSIGDSVIRPIQRLAAAMVALGRGRRVPPLPTTGGGEFRTLAAGFNDMAARLHADTEELERRIEMATRAVVTQKDAAEQATRAKSRFIAAASHDLRQPLHAIGLFTATLQRRARGAEFETVVRDLGKAVAVMERLFDTLLDISRLDAGTMRVDARPVSLDRLFTQLAAEYADAARQRHLRLEIRPTTCVVVTDELLLHRLLSNLVANAIRYTNAGTVLVCCRYRSEEVAIEVRDSGIGIPQEKQREIFQEFYQIGNPARDRSLGLGLGLAIVSRIARLLETDVVVRSAPGRGSVFSLRLRRASVVATEPIVPAESVGTAIGGEYAKLEVLVIDDDPLVLAGNQALLEDMGCTVTAVRDAPDALAALAAMGGRAVLALCDFWLPDERGGIDLLQRLSALTTSPFSGILISGDTRPETIQAAKSAGFPLLHKPVAPARLRAVVMQFAWTVRESANPEIGNEDTSG
jgi:signal transduction histidine kinase